jgi:hypothetical protein
MTAPAGSSTLTLAGGTVAATTNCVLTVPVVAAAAGAYQITAAAVSGLANLTNGVGTSTLVVDAPLGTPPAWSDTTLGAMRVGVPFGDAVAAIGSPTPTYAVTAGSLPPGIALDPVTGALTGTPTTPGPYQFTITASTGVASLAQDFSGTVRPAVPHASVHGGVGGITTDLLDDLRSARPSGVDVSAITATPSGQGSWALLPDGGVFTAGDAQFFGSLGATPLRDDAVGIATTETGGGYWIVTRDGGVFAFGDATFHGSMGAVELNQPIVGLTPTCSGGGYYLVAEDGGVFAFGDATFHGSMGVTPLNKGMAGIVPTCSGGGYWTYAADGGVFTFGDARYFGSLGNAEPPVIVAGLIPTATEGGYWLVDDTDGTHPFGDAT